MSSIAYKICNFLQCLYAIDFAIKFCGHSNYLVFVEKNNLLEDERKYKSQEKRTRNPLRVRRGNVKQNKMEKPTRLMQCSLPNKLLYRNQNNAHKGHKKHPIPDQGW